MEDSKFDDLDSLEDYLIEMSRKCIKEYASPKEKYTNDIESLLIPIFNNLACIAIFHDVGNIDIINHWMGRAKGLPLKEIEKEIKTKRREVPINKAFEEDFGTNYEDIKANWYNTNIIYYKARERKNKIYANNTADFYFEKYTPIIVNALDKLKEAFILMDYEIWDKAVDNYVEQVNKFLK